MSRGDDVVMGTVTDNFIFSGASEYARASDTPVTAGNTGSIRIRQVGHQDVSGPSANPYTDPVLSLRPSDGARSVSACHESSTF